MGLRVADPDIVSRFRNSVFDGYVRAVPRTADPAFPVKVVAIDEAALARYGQWPWPRSQLAELARKLIDAGARSVTFDVILAEPDRLSPAELAKSIEIDEETPPEIIALTQQLAREPSNDNKLATAISNAPVVVGLVGDDGGTKVIGKPKAALSFAGDYPGPFVPSFNAGIVNRPEIAAAASGIGAVNWMPSDDQIVRRAPLLISIAGALFPSLALETLRVSQNQTTVFVKSSGGSGIPAFGQRSGIDSLRVGDVVVPTDARGEMWLRFAPSDPRRTLSAGRILSGEFDAADIRGRSILIGATAAGLLDLRSTALNAAMPGVEVHAQALEQLLSGEHIARPAYANGLEIAFIIVAGSLVAWLVSRSGAVIAATVGAVAIVTTTVMSWVAYTRGGLLFDPVTPSLAIVVLYIGTSLATYVRSENDRSRIRQAFSHYVAPSLVAELVRNHDSLKLGGETRVVTLLFADVRGFSRMSEQLTAEDLIRFVNRLFTPLTETILRHGGTIDKFMGDAVMAFWNAPINDPLHARNACRAALEMQRDVARLNEEFAREARAGGDIVGPIRIGIGINTGACVVGNVGSPERFDYSVLGDVVNVAARFEEETKTSGFDIIVGEATALSVSGFSIVDAGTIKLRNKDRPEKVFGLMEAG